MVVGNFGFGGADAGKNRGFADARIADQTDIRQHFQLQGQLFFLALGAVFGKHGNLPGRGGEMAVSKAATSALATDVIGAVALGHVVQDLSGGGVPDQGSGRHRNNQIFGGRSMEFGSFSVLAVFGDELVLVAEGKQGVASGIHPEDHIAAVPAVAAVGSAVGNIFFPVKGNGTVSAVARFDINSDVIHKHGNTLLSKEGFKK